MTDKQYFHKAVRSQKIADKITVTISKLQLKRQELLEQADRYFFATGIAVRNGGEINFA